MEDLQIKIPLLELLSIHYVGNSTNPYDLNNPGTFRIVIHITAEHSKNTAEHSKNTTEHSKNTKTVNELTVKQPRRKVQVVYKNKRIHVIIYIDLT